MLRASTVDPCPGGGCWPAWKACHMPPAAFAALPGSSTCAAVVPRLISALFFFGAASRRQTTKLSPYWTSSEGVSSKRAQVRRMMRTCVVAWPKAKSQREGKSGSCSTYLQSWSSGRGPHLRTPPRMKGSWARLKTPASPPILLMFVTPVRAVPPETKPYWNMYIRSCRRGPSFRTSLWAMTSYGADSCAALKTTMTPLSLARSWYLCIMSLIQTLSPFTSM
mmetsp:Transcript_33366/g.105753  ORF Transcript_33366/g.105753 Transcript_33366/m.105753 type:complete len:222 (-) Transcript_33366:356-1021(-)